MVFTLKKQKRTNQMAYLTSAGLWIPERPHTPQECEQVECKDCFESVGDPDEEYCEACGEPVCLDCQKVVHDEPLCAACFALLAKEALKRLRRDPLVGDVFQEAA
jgi:hypothetical protein